MLLPAAPSCCGSAAAARLPRSSAARRCGAALPPPSAAPYATGRAQRTQRRPAPPPRADTQQVASSGPSVAISLADVLVRDVMTKPPTLVRPDTSVFDVLEARCSASGRPSCHQLSRLGACALARALRLAGARIRRAGRAFRASQPLRTRRAGRGVLVLRCARGAAALTRRLLLRCFCFSLTPPLAPRSCSSARASAACPWWTPPGKCSA